MEKSCLFESGNYISRKNTISIQHKNKPRYADADPGISEPGGAVKFLGSGDCLDASIHIPYIFCS